MKNALLLWSDVITFTQQQCHNEDPQYTVTVKTSMWILTLKAEGEFLGWRKREEKKGTFQVFRPLMWLTKSPFIHFNGNFVIVEADDVLLPLLLSLPFVLSCGFAFFLFFCFEVHRSERCRWPRRRLTTRKCRQKCLLYVHDTALYSQRIPTKKKLQSATDDPWLEELKRFNAKKR